MYYLVNIVVLVDESQAKHRNADHHVLEVIFCQQRPGVHFLNNELSAGEYICDDSYGHIEMS